MVDFDQVPEVEKPESEVPIRSKVSFSSAACVGKANGRSRIADNKRHMVFCIITLLFSNL